MNREVRLTAGELDSIRDMIPAPEPRLSTSRGPVIPVSATSLDGREAEYLAECIRSNWISSAGPFVAKFEKAFARAAGCTFGIATSSGTAALHLALAALGVGPGDEVVMPALTMIATANAAVYTGARPVLVDSEPRTGNIDPSRIAEKINSRTRAIIPVHLYGNPVSIDPIRRLADARGIPVVEDAAEAHGARIGRRPAGSLGAAACFSFYGNKIVTTGEGGMVTTSDASLARRLQLLRGHAFSTERHFWHARLGFNYRMTNLQAAVGLAQTERLAELVGARRDAARLYREHLRDVRGLVLPEERRGSFAVFWMFAIRVRPDFGMSRDALRAFLAARGIETRSFFVPIHAQPLYFRSFRGERYPVAEELSRTGLYLPSSARLTEAEIARIAAAVREAAASARSRPRATGGGAKSGDVRRSRRKGVSGRPRSR
jgi:perosamine synthetase